MTIPYPRSALAMAFVAALLAGTAAQAQTSGTQPVTQELSLEQRSALRCAAAFALGAQAQREGQAVAQDWPPLGQRGREFFVRTAARLMDELALPRETVAAMAMREAEALQASGEVAQVMPTCLMLLDAAGIEARNE